MQGTFFIVPSINVKSVFFYRGLKTLATQAIIEGLKGVISNGCANISKLLFLPFPSINEIQHFYIGGQKPLKTKAKTPINKGFISIC